MKRYWSFVAVIAVAWLIGFAVYIGFREGSGGVASAPTSLQMNPPIGELRPDFELPDLKGQLRHIDEWKGQVVLINFWATWCPPCRREIPSFIEVRKNLHAEGFEVIGVAIDDLHAVERYSAEMGITYPVLVGQSDAAAVSRQLGNSMGALPYSVLIDRQGAVRYAKAGELSGEQLLVEARKYLDMPH